MSQDHYIFKNGHFISVSSVYFGEDEFRGEWSSYLPDFGYMETKQYGGTNSFCFSLWEYVRGSSASRHLKETPAWIVTIVTMYQSCVVRVFDWPDLLELLQRLSPIVLAGAIERSDSGRGVFPVQHDEKEIENG